MCILVQQSVSQALFDDIIHHFPNPLEFHNIQSCVLKAIIHRKKSGMFYIYLSKVFLFQKDAFYYISNGCGI